MRELLFKAVVVAAVVAMAEAAAVAFGWSPPLWLLAGAVAVAGVAAFLTAGRRRALRLQARRRACGRVRPRDSAATAGGESVRLVARETATAAAADRGGRPQA